MGTYTYHARRNAGLCGMCGEVASQSAHCGECKVIDRIKRVNREQPYFAPFCACGRHRLWLASEWDRCWECRKALGFYEARRPRRARTDAMRATQRVRTRVWRAKLKAEKALRPQQPVLKAARGFNVYPRVSGRTISTNIEGRNHAA